MTHTFRRYLTAAVAALLLGLSFAVSSFAAQRYTEKQLQAFATRIGKTFWVVSVDGRLPTFASAPDPRAPQFQPKANESFEITELVGGQTRTPYYKVKFETGKEAYLRVDTFHEEFNATLLTSDPLAAARERAAEKEAQEKQRLDWIQTRNWSQMVKDAAVRREPVIGMNIDETRKVVGEPMRTTKLRATKKNQNVREEQWFYPDGSVLVFRNGILQRIEHKTNAQPSS